jgi:hypothetical protein
VLISHSMQTKAKGNKQPEGETAKGRMGAWAMRRITHGEASLLSRRVAVSPNRPFAVSPSGS